MKPYKTIIIAAALTFGTSMAFAQSTNSAGALQGSDMNKSVGDGSSGGKNVGGQEKAGAPSTPQAGVTGASKTTTANEKMKADTPKEAKTGDAVSTTGTGAQNEKKH